MQLHLPPKRSNKLLDTQKIPQVRRPKLQNKLQGMQKTPLNRLPKTYRKRLVEQGRLWNKLPVVRAEMKEPGPSSQLKLDDLKMLFLSPSFSPFTTGKT